MKKKINSKPHYWELDYIRFFAAFCVMALHYWIRGFAKNDNISPFHFPNAGHIVQYYYLAVNLFFMISGFVIFMSIDKIDLSATKNNRDRFKDSINFLRSRALRLYPAFWFCCTLTFVSVKLFTPDLIPLSFARYIANLTLLNGAINIGDIDGPYWTLWVEIKFYLLIGLAIATGVIRHPIALISALTCISISNYQIESNIINSIFFTSYLPYFCAGATFLLIKRKVLKYGAIPLLIANFYAGFQYDAIRLAEKEIHYGFPFLKQDLIIYLTSFFAIMLMIGKIGQNRYPRIATAAGAISYPLYLIHNNVGMIVFNKANGIAPPWIIVSATMILMTGFAYFICTRIEPIIRKEFAKVWKPLPTNEQAI